MNPEFRFEPASWVPFRDRAVLERVRGMSGTELEKHPNPKLKIKVTQNIGAIEIADMFANIRASDDFDRKFTFICGNPCPDAYKPLAELINLNRVNCRNVFPFTMDEWADDQGNVAPITYRSGFTYSFLKYFYNNIDPELRMPLSNIHYPTTENIGDYSRMITDCGEGGADVCYSGPGWAAHIAFIDPSPELLGCETIEEYLQQPAQVLTLHPLTVAQNSLHGVFGCSGDIANIPPKAATIGPLDVVRARKRLEFHGLTTMGTFSSWQRMTSRLILHGPVTPYVPGSIFQLMEANIYVSEEIAAPIECMETVGY